MDYRLELRRIYLSLPSSRQRALRQTVLASGRSLTWLEKLTSGNRPVSSSQLEELAGICSNLDEFPVFVGLIAAQQEAIIARSYSVLGEDFDGTNETSLLVFGRSKRGDILERFRLYRYRAFNGQLNLSLYPILLADSWTQSFNAVVSCSQPCSEDIRDLVDLASSVTEICNAGKRPDLALQVSRRALWLFVTSPASFYGCSKDQILATQLNLARYFGIAIKNSRKVEKRSGYHALWDGFCIAEQIVDANSSKTIWKGEFGQAYALLAAEAIRDVAKSLRQQAHPSIVRYRDDFMDGIGLSIEHNSFFSILKRSQYRLRHLQDNGVITNESNLLLTDALVRGYGSLSLTEQADKDNFLSRSESSLKDLSLIASDNQICAAWKTRSVLQHDWLCGKSISVKIEQMKFEFRQIPYVASAFGGPLHLL